MKQRMLFVILALVALSVTAIFVSAAQVSSQGPIDIQSGQATGDAQPQAPAAPTSLLFSYQGQLLNSSGNPITNPALPMVFRLYTAPSGGTACWSESRTVDVRTGVFNVLLGQTTAINSACLAGDAYLELVVAGETLTPRERLTSVAHAVEASTLPNGAITRGSLTVNGDTTINGSVAITTGAVPLHFREADQTGPGSLWRTVLDSRYMRFDASQNGNDFSSYTTAIGMWSSGDVWLGGTVGTAAP